jgi:hypothetical protein
MEEHKSGRGCARGWGEGQIEIILARFFFTGAREWGLAVVGELGREVVAV